MGNKVNNTLLIELFKHPLIKELWWGEIFNMGYFDCDKMKSISIWFSELPDLERKDTRKKLAKIENLLFEDNQGPSIIKYKI